MKIIIIMLLIVLSSCNAFIKHKNDLKPIAHDMIDEGIDDAIKTNDTEKLPSN